MPVNVSVKRREMQRGFTSQRPILAELEHDSFGDRARGERLGLVERSKSGETRGGTGRIGEPPLTKRSCPFGARLGATEL